MKRSDNIKIMGVRHQRVQNQALESLRKRFSECHLYVGFEKNAMWLRAKVKMA